jgi:NAD+--asparagine ADP-ribosyltransferase
MIKLTDLMKGHGKFEQGVVYSNPYHTAFKSQVKEEVIEEATTKLDFTQASGVEFMASSNNGKIVLIPKSIKDKSKIETVISKLGNGGEDDFLSLVQIRLEKKLGLKVIADKRYSGAGYAFEIDMDTLLKKL